MALTCPVDFDTVTLRAEIQTMYSRVATMPDGAFHFHRGPEYAVNRLGYNSTELATLPLRARASAGAAECGLAHVEVCDSDTTRLPVGDSSVDVVISNGVLNLVPDKFRAIGEIARVLRPGGRAQIADIVIGEILPERTLRDIDLWTG
jgi:arsenite methyltransferase